MGLFCLAFINWAFMQSVILQKTSSCRSYMHELKDTHRTWIDTCPCPIETHARSRRDTYPCPEWYILMPRGTHPAWVPPGRSMCPSRQGACDMPLPGGTHIPAWSDACPARRDTCPCREWHMLLLGVTGVEQANTDICPVANWNIFTPGKGNIYDPSVFMPQSLLQFAI